MTPQPSRPTIAAVPSECSGAKPVIRLGAACLITMSAFTTLETFTAGYILYSYFVSFLYSYGLYPNPESLEAASVLGWHGNCSAV
jgi:hypothetical protein